MQDVICTLHGYASVSSCQNQGERVAKRARPEMCMAAWSYVQTVDSLDTICRSETHSHTPLGLGGCNLRPHPHHVRLHWQLHSQLLLLLHLLWKRCRSAPPGAPQGHHRTWRWMQRGAASSARENNEICTAPCSAAPPFFLRRCCCTHPTYRGTRTDATCLARERRAVAPRAPRGRARARTYN